MKSRYRSIRLRIILICLICIPITSCYSPPAPQHWFNEAISLEKDVYPPGVNFEVLREGDNECFSDSIIVTNSSNTPIYIPAISHWSRPTDLEELDEPCPNKNLCMKLVSNKAWEWNIINRGESPPWDYDWVLVDMFGDSENLEIHIFGSAVLTSSYVIQSIELLNEFDDGSGRPDDVIPPSPQEFDLLYMYEDQELSTKATITYSINECYEEYRIIDPFEHLLECYVAFVIVFVAMFALIVNTVIKRIKRKARSRNEQAALNGQ